MPKISIIVPVYNVEAYLHKCINSILAQTFEDFELILIDDKSPDSSGEICDKYAERDSRIRVIHKLKNQGVSSARNEGLDEAQGEYITFIDSDDWVEPVYLEHLYHLAVENGADMTSCMYEYDGDLNSLNRTADVCEGEVRQKTTIITDEDFIWGKWYSSVEAWCKLYSRVLIEDNGIRFDMSFNNGEDTLFYANAMLCSKKCVASTQVLYHYYQRTDSASNAKTIQQYADQTKVWHIIMNKMDKYWNSYHSSGRMLLWNLLRYVTMLKSSNNLGEQDIRNIQQIFRHLRRYRCTQGGGIKFEISYLLLEWNIPLYLKVIEKKNG